MDDLISRQWLMECVNEGWIKFDTEKDENRFMHLVRDIAPSTDAIEVVRCKDCKHADEYYHCIFSTIWNDMNHYCGKGERKDG